MSVSLSLTCFISPSKSHLRTNLSRLNSPRITIPLLPPRPKNHNPPIIRCIHEKSDHLPVIQTKPRWEDILSTAASLYPVYVTVGGAVAVIKPSAYAWFVQRGPASYTLSIGLIMLAMGLTLKIRDLVGLFIRPYIAFLLPWRYSFQCGTFVPVDAVKLSLSTLQVVIAPVLLGSYLQSTFPAAVKVVTPYAPLLAVLTSSLLACSVFSENVIRIKSSMTGASLVSEVSVSMRIQSLLSGELGSLLLSVVLLHSAGFFVGYLSAAIIGFKERQRRVISIEVGMQNSSLGVVLAASHFTSSMVALPAAMSAVIMNIMGSSLGFFWRNQAISREKNRAR